MTNFDIIRKRYGNWLPSKERIIYHYGVDKKTGDLKMCSELDCSNCVFTEPLDADCDINTARWLASEVVE